VSLNWDARKAENWDALEWEKKQSLIFSCIPVGIGEITEANHEEWYSRYRQWYIANGWDDPYLTLADVRNGIGLSTNVFPKETDAKFRKKIAGIVERKAQAIVAEALRQEKEAANGGADQEATA